MFVKEVTYFWKLRLILLTVYGDSIDKPANLGFGLSTDSTGQDASLIGGEDQVPGSADPERSRCEWKTAIQERGVIFLKIIMKTSLSFLLMREARQEYNWLRLFTFDSDLDDMACNAQPVCGWTAVLPTISFIHIRNSQCSLKVLKGHPAVRQLSSILLPGDLWSGPVREGWTTKCLF